MMILSVIPEWGALKYNTGNFAVLEEGNFETGPRVIYRSFSRSEAVERAKKILKSEEIKRAEMNAFLKDPVNARLIVGLVE